MEKMAWGGTKWGQEFFFPTNPDLANILGRTDLDFEIFIFWILWIPYFQNSRLLDFQISRFLDLGTRFLAMAGCGSGGHQSPDLGGFWTALPDHRIQEIQGARPRP